MFAAYILSFLHNKLFLCTVKSSSFFNVFWFLSSSLPNLYISLGSLSLQGPLFV